MVKQWKANGPEQELLERMFDDGSIEEWETPVSVQARDPLFKPFSERVFATHFREIKNKMGYGHSGPNAVQVNTDNSIPELGQLVALRSQSQFHHRHLLLNLYFVCVAVYVISGCRVINFVLSEDGTKLQINYIWPSALYTPQELFENQLNRNALTLDHPKIHALTSRLLECGITAKSSPQASTIIDLPTKVLREIGTWSKSGVKSNDSRIALLEFQAFTNKIIIEDADTTISFD